MGFKRKLTGSLIAVVGFMLSPLSWWNDAFVNLPLALVFAWVVSAPFAGDHKAKAFHIAVIVGYWLTNVLGFVLLHKGASQVVERDAPPPRHNLRRDILISIAYTLFIVMLIKLGVLKPFAAYFPTHT